jgi:hypothetical protein
MQVRFGNFVHPDTCDETVRSFCVVDKCQPEKEKEWVVEEVRSL